MHESTSLPPAQQTPGLFGRLFSFLRRLLGWLPISARGLFLILASVTLFRFYGRLSADWILLVVGVFGIVLAGLSSLSVGMTFLLFDWRIRRKNVLQHTDPLKGETAKPLLSDFYIPRLWLPFLDFMIDWEDKAATIDIVDTPVGRTESVRFSRRRYTQEIVRVFVVRDLFGLAECRWKYHQKRECKILPGIHEHPPSLIRALIDGDGKFVPSRPRVGDRVDTRKYIPGDPVRYIHWKLFAKTSEPVIRIPEPAAVYDKQVIAYLLCDEEDEFAAEVARWALARGGLGSKWFFSADHCEGYADELATAHRFLCLSGRDTEPEDGGLASFLENVRFRPQQHRLVLFASGNLEAWLSRAMPTLQRYAAVTSLVLASEKEHKASEGSVASEPLWVRLFLRKVPEEKVSGPALWRSLQQLMRDGLQLQNLHREGEQISTSASRRMGVKGMDTAEPVSILIREASAFSTQQEPHNRSER